VLRSADANKPKCAHLPSVTFAENQTAALGLAIKGRKYEVRKSAYSKTLYIELVAGLGLQTFWAGR